MVTPSITRSLLHLTLPGLHATQYFSPPIRRDLRSSWSDATVNSSSWIVGHTSDVIQFNNNSLLGVHISQLQAVKKKIFSAIKFSRECRKFFTNHINCSNSEKNRSQNFISYALKITEKYKERSVYFFTRCDVRKLTCLTAKFQEDPVEPLREIAWRSYGI